MEFTSPPASTSENNRTDNLSTIPSKKKERGRKKKTLVRDIILNGTSQEEEDEVPLVKLGKLPTLGN